MEITLFEMVATSIYLSEVDTPIVLCLNLLVKHQLTVIELLINKKKKNWLQISNKLKKKINNENGCMYLSFLFNCHNL